MSEVLICGGAGGADSDDCTASANDVLKGKTAIVNGSEDEPIIGTLELTGNAIAAYVYTGKTFYNTNPKSKLTGTMTVNSLLSFSVAAYSGKRVLAKWQNPKAAAGKPYSGVYIRYSTSGTPGKTGGTQVYKGYGNNKVSDGISSVYLDMPSLNTLYYFTIYPYATCSAGEMTGEVINTTCKTSGEVTKTFTASQSYTVYGYTKADIFLVGGGGSGSYGSSNGNNGGGGAGGGYTLTEKGKSITNGQTLVIVIGAGGNATGSTTAARTGGSSYVNGLTSEVAGGKPSSSPSAGAGGSGGGRGKKYDNGDDREIPAVPGGSDGSSSYGGGTGQGTTTRAFSNTNGTLYSGGGGGAGGNSGYSSGAAGGAGGGGKGGDYGVIGVSGGINTGGGGGGSGARTTTRTSGGSGIVLIRFY